MIRTKKDQILVLTEGSGVLPPRHLLKDLTGMITNKIKYKNKTKTRPN